ncbi:MAG: cbb3-type cytochrome c oxidase subunit I [Planctomycetes bacterium]|nr:cbb3-type cytochrome c oxidase subunit I [Planctomycetota bacterium]
MANDPANAMPASLDPGQRDAARWFTLALASIAVAGTLAIVLVVGRLPGISEIVITDVDFAKRSLVVHVNLALAVWFFSFLAGLFCLLPGARKIRTSPLAVALATLGTLLFVSTIFVPSATPILCNYVPALHHWLFLTGIALFGVGVALNFLDARMLPVAVASPHVPPEARFGLRAAGLIYLCAMITFAGAYATNADSLLVRQPAATDVQYIESVKAYFEYLFWGGGHVLQIANETAMVAAWLILLSRVIRKSAVPVGAASGLFLLLMLPTAFGPWLSFGAHDRTWFTRMMQFGIFPAVSVFIIWCFAGVFRARASLRPGDLKSPAFVGFCTSAAMTVIGYLLGASIRGSDTLIPAHYHVAIGAVSAAFMALLLTLLPEFGRPLSSLRMRKLATWQPLLFGIGQTIFAAGLAIAGAQRKVYGKEQVVDTTKRYTGLIVMGTGGGIALVGGILFIVIVVAALRAVRRVKSQSSHD